MIYKEREKQMKTHKDLNVWKKSMSLVSEIYTITKSFPEYEKYGITSQLRRSAISIPSNIAEGSARRGNKEFVQFLYIALGSATELDTQVLIAKDLGYLIDSDTTDQIEDIRKMLVGLIKHQKSLA